MLQQLSEQIQECYRRAAEAKAQADATTDPAIKQCYLDLEDRWLLLARSRMFTESLEDFTAQRRRQDATERKRSERQITTSAEKAEHQTKTVLATVQAAADRSHAGTTAGAKRSIAGRLRALADVHALLARSRREEAELSNVVCRQLGPYLGSREARARVDGPQMLLPANAAQAIAVSVHELSANAAKYGSLSVPEGNVEVTWSLAEDGRLILQWIETGGPPTTKPTREGFGTSIIDRAIRELKGEAQRDWRPEGLACQITLRLRS